MSSEGSSRWALAQSFGLPGSLAERYDAHQHGDARGGAVTSLVEPPRAPNLAPERERPPELDPDHGPRLRDPARMQHHAQDAVDAEPGVPEAGVGLVHLARLASQ